MKVPKDTWVRTIVLLITLLNQLLELSGKNPLPFSEEEWYQLVSGLLTIGTALWVWWKNNVFTKEAIAAEAYRTELKLERKKEEKKDTERGKKNEL